MRSFKDREGVEWNILVTMGTVRRLKNELGIDIVSNDPKENGFTKLSQDECLPFDALYLVCEKQIKERNIASVEAFCERFEGDSVQAAIDALLWAVVDFTPSARKREVLAKSLNSFRALVEKGLIAAESQMDEEMEKAEALILDGMKSSASPEPAALPETPLTI